MSKTLLVILLCASVWAQKYSGPRPPKPDIPYLWHADNLLETEGAQAREENARNEITYVIPGDHSPARTPLASPIFLMVTNEIQPQRLQLFHLTSRNGQREILFKRKTKQIARPIRLNVTRLDETLFRVEVDEILENGEYSLTPEGSNQVFCFQVY